MKKLISLLLALMLALSILPMAALAAEEPEIIVDGKFFGVFDELIRDADGNFFGYVAETESGMAAYTQPLTGEMLEAAQKFYNEWLATQQTAEPHTHEFGLTYTRSGHYYACSCGDRTAIQAHEDPLTTDGRCFCGYKYMSNADLTVLWLSGMTLNQPFDPDVTEYEATLYTYKDVTKTKISAKSFDAMADVEKPEDLTIKEGTNKFEIKVTAEDGKTTKTYTVTVVK